MESRLSACRHLVRWRPLISVFVASALIMVGTACSAPVDVKGNDDRLASPDGAAVHLDFATLAALPPEFTTIERDRSSYPLRLTDGRLEHGEPLDTNAASYLSRDLEPAQVRRIGTVADFGKGAAGSIALLVSNGAVPTSESEPAPNAAVHFVADSEGWSYAVWKAGGSGQTVLERGTYGKTFDSRNARFEVELTGDTAKVYLPDSTSVQVTDERISSFGGSWATWELFEGERDVKPAALREIWVA